MAKVEKIGNLLGGDEMINVDSVVGNKQGVFADIMVVQALLKFCTQFTKKWNTVPAPEPNGILCKNTQKLIFDYQEFIRRRNQGAWVAKDGRVSPAHQKVALLAKQEFTIVSLNGDAGMIAAAFRLPEHIDAISRRWPQVAFVLGRNPLFL